MNDLPDKKSEMLKPVLVLFFVAFFAALIIGVTYTVTEEPIRQQRENAEMAAILTLFPNTYRIEFEDIQEQTLTGKTSCFDENGNLIGFVFSASPAGYSGLIHMMIAINTDSYIEGVRVVRHTETPGLGSNITQDWFLEEFAGRDTVPFVAAHNPTADNEIQLITSATISVNAFLVGVNDAVEYFERMVR